MTMEKKEAKLSVGVSTQVDMAYSPCGKFSSRQA